MRRLCLVGADGHGKTTLAEALIPIWTAQGLVVGVIKHSGHVHELDKPGKDSHRMRSAGARPAAIVTAELAGVFLPLAAGEDAFARLAPLFADCDLVLIEGHKSGPYPKVEVYRAAAGGRPLAERDPTIRAVVSDDPLELAVPVLPRVDVDRLAEALLELCGP